MEEREWRCVWRKTALGWSFRVSQSFFEGYIPGKIFSSVFEADFVNIYDLSLSCSDALLGTPSAAAPGKI